MHKFFTPIKSQKVIIATAFLLVCFAFNNAFAQCTYFTKVFTGPSSRHALGIKSDGTLWAWGNNTNGELGINSNTDANEPTQVGTATNWVLIATGNEHTLGITADGKLWAWGLGTEGQLGDGGTTPNVLTPEEITGYDNNWVAVSACDNHSFAISGDGKLWAWGYGAPIFLGNGTGASSVVPILIGTDADWVTVSTGHLHTIALKKDGTLWAWGRNGEGEAGDSTTLNNVYTPEQISTSTNWIAINAGYEHSVALQKDNTLWSWGNNTNGELGNGTTTNGTDGPKQVGTQKWIAAAAGLTHALGITPDGNLWAWGEGGLGQLGDGNSASHDVTTPELIDSFYHWNAVYGGYEFSLGLAGDNSVWTTGNFALGNGTATRTFDLVNVGVPAIYPALALNGGSKTLFQRRLDDYAVDCADLITEVTQSGADQIHGTTTATVWIDGTVQTDATNKPYVQRHSQVMPANGDAAATGTVTLYFSQNEFTAYNSFAKVTDGTYPMLPTDASDVANYKSNLRINQIGSVSSDGSGALNTYSGTRTIIIPTSVQYINSRWQVTFNVSGFGGFFVTTGETALPLTWLNTTAILNNQKQAQINWQVQEQNVVSYDIEKSLDGNEFNLLATTAGKGNGINSYQFTDPQKILPGNIFYRIKQIDKDGRFSYSNVVSLNVSANGVALSLFPNPGNNHFFITGLQGNKTYHAIVTDISGKQILKKELSGSQNEIFTSAFPQGIYFVKIITDEAIVTMKYLKE